MIAKLLLIVLAIGGGLSPAAVTQTPLTPPDTQRTTQDPKRPDSESPESLQSPDSPIGIDPESVQTPITIADIDQQLAGLEGAPDSEAASVATAKELLSQAKQQLLTLQKSQAQTQQYLQGIESAAQDLVSARQRLEQKAADPSPIDSQKTLAELRLELDQATAELAKIRQEVTRTAGEPSRRQARLLELPELIAAAEDGVEQLAGQIKQNKVSGEAAALVAARETQLRIQQAAQRQQIEAYLAERQFYAATTELVPLQTELLQRKSQMLQTQIALLNKAIEAKRESDIDRLRRVMAKQVEQTPIEIQAEAKLNATLVEQYVSVSQRLGEITTTLETTRATLEEIESQFKISEERVEAVGLNETLGLMFRRNKAWLATERRKFVPDGSLQGEIRQLQVELFRLQDLWKQSTDAERSIDQMYAESDVAGSRQDELRPTAESIMGHRRDILTPLIQSHTELFNQLVALDTGRRKVVLEIDTYTAYINKHVLWIRSGSVLGRGDFGPLRDALQWTFDTNNVMALTTAFRKSIQEKPVLFIFLVISLGGLGLMQRRFRKLISSSGKKAESSGCRTILPTFVSLLNTILIASYWPFFMIAIGWMLLNVSSATFVQATARALLSVGVTIFPLELLRQSCRSSGLGQSHFGWAEGSRKYARFNLSWLNPTLSGLLFFVCLLQHQPSEEYRSSLGRLIMIVLLCVPFIYIFKVLHPNSQFYRAMTVRHREAFLYRFRILRFIVTNLIVLGLMLFTLGGYYYTTYQIGSRLLQTIALIIVIAILFATAMRWLLVRRRNMKLEEMAARRAESIRTGNDQAVGENLKVDLSNEPGLDANAVSKQARELLLVVTGMLGLWVAWQIWSDLTPAVGILDSVELWSVNVAGVTEQVTLQNLLYSLLGAVITIVAVKNLPGILELLLLRRLPMDAGSRYAVATIVRYIIAVLGMIIACGILKVQWVQFSWLVAAISVGLGFGLQEIVANFVSGLILLMERPVRIGDVVTIEGTTGVISKIQMRATTVTNFDQQELVVPNKNLITSSIFNWTLSNVLTRITLEVGVAYGSDPNFVQGVILDVLKNHVEVIEEPAPSVTFQTFGESSLNFVARCCISGPEKRLTTIHQLQVAINRVLEENRIEIPFPQRVLHVENNSLAELKSPDSDG